MNVKTIARRVGRTINKNSPSILSAVAIGGVFTTAFYAVKNHQQATDLLEEEDPDLGEGHERAINYVKATWQCYIPTAVSGTVTVASILGANRIGHRRAAAAQAAFVVAERAYAEYRDQIIQEFGEGKDKAIRDKIAENRVKEHEPPLIITGNNILCCELYTGRYFLSDMESLRRAENELNARLVHHDQACFEDFYDMIGLPPTSYSGELGWTSDKLMKLEFTSILSEDGRPVLAFEYNYHRPLYEGLF